MAVWVRIVNAFYAALFLVGLFISLGFLLAASEGFGRGPWAVWLSSGWAALAALLAILCLVNLRRAGTANSVPLIGANLAALLLAAAALLTGDPVLQWIGGVSILPFAITLPALISGRART